jgi:hypothetical protein
MDWTLAELDLAVKIAAGTVVAVGTVGTWVGIAIRRQFDRTAREFDRNRDLWQEQVRSLKDDIARDTSYFERQARDLRLERDEARQALSSCRADLAACESRQRGTKGFVV